MTEQPNLRVYRLVGAVALEIGSLTLCGVGIIGFIAAAYAYSRQFPPTQWIDSPGEVLSELNSAPNLVFIGLPAIALSSVMAFMILISLSRTRRRAWIVPVVTIGLALLTFAVAVATMRKF